MLSTKKETCFVKLEDNYFLNIKSLMIMNI